MSFPRPKLIIESALDVLTVDSIGLGQTIGSQFIKEDIKRQFFVDFLVIFTNNYKKFLC